MRIGRGQNLNGKMMERADETKKHRRSFGACCVSVTRPDRKIKGNRIMIGRQG